MKDKKFLNKESKNGEVSLENSKNKKKIKELSQINRLYNLNLILKGMFIEEKNHEEKEEIFQKKNFFMSGEEN